MTYVYAFDHRHGLPLEEAKAIVGGKAANIGVMVTELGLPVPPGFAISTEACRAYLTDGWPNGLDDEIREHLGLLEAALGREFGGAAEPLLLSVRSGAPVSMPGMMDTVLNLGINDTTVKGVSAMAGDPAFGESCRIRLETMYRDVVGAVEVPADVWEQLRGAIEAVFRSWNSERARSYRAYEGIPEDMGTAVAVQTMVFGNLDDDSGTGVIFTRNPATGEPGLYGDVLFRAQGEDVVAGTHHTEPISVLDERMPQIARELRGYADGLERHYADVCDIEFTIERGKLWMLQTRIGKRSPQAALRIAVDMANEEGFPLTRAEAVERVVDYLADPPMTQTERGDDSVIVATGLAASPGLASGVIATTPDTAVEIADSGRSVILVRTETSPDDVHGMSRAVGILTSTGGLTSHAAVVARGWGKPAVVGAAEVKVAEGTVVIGDRELGHDDVLTIDGGTGEVFEGAVGGAAVVVPEAATLLDWAMELGVGIGEEGRSAMTDHDDSGAEPPATDMAVRALAIKGFVMPDGLAAALLATEDEAAAILDEMSADGLVEEAAGMHRLTEAGKAVGDQLMTADQEHWGVDGAVEALDAFLALDRRMKTIVTAWQMREVEGEQILNDHSDEGYDASVLADLGELHEDAAAWLEPLTESLPRLETYARRLQRASRMVGDGDHKYIAAPMLDSYHTIWFELHEDLILLAGRTRADETAAGRA